jgi:CBS domain-containing protein
MRVRDVMTHSPVCCHPNDSAQVVAKILCTKDIGSVLVIAQGESRLLGIITDRDLCCSIVAKGLDPKTTPIQPYVRRDPVTCRPEQSIDSCEKLMQTHQVRRLPVVDGKGRCVGMVSQADLVRSEEPAKVQRTIAEISKPAQIIVPPPPRRTA